MAVADEHRKLGRFELLYELAAGGMATLYLARVSGLAGFEKLVAIKRIHPHLSRERQFIEMFLDEARIAARLHHPNIAQIYELGEVDRSLFIAMEYVEGESLARFARAYLKLQRERGGPKGMPIRECAAVVAEAAAGLHAAHELRGADGEPLELVHRDVSPHNILVTYDGYVKLIDFGVAKARGRISHTQGSSVKGKVAYMSPEQIQAQPLDRRSDVFSLGIVLHEMTCGRRLFKSDIEVETLRQILQADIPRPSSLRPDYPPPLEQVVMKALARDPAQRYQTADEMRRAILNALHEGGPPVGASEIGALMRDIFGERMQLKARLREAPEPGRADRSDVSALIGSSDTLEFSAKVSEAADAVPAAVTAGLPATAPKKHRGLIALGIGALAAALVVVAGLWWRTASAPEVGGLRVDSTPPGAQVAVDHGLRTAVTPAVIPELALGPHDVRVWLNGYQAYEKQIEITQPGQEFVLDATLVREVEPVPEAPVAPPVEPVAAPAAEPQPPPATEPVKHPPREPVQPVRRPGANRSSTEKGKLTLKTIPWSEVSLGKKKLGVTPLVGVELPAGSHRLTLLPEGKPPARTVTVKIAPGEHRREEIKLK
ncbi:MAG: serine/threonine-protein kinase [Pseudomonadota bacterium]